MEWQRETEAGEYTLFAPESVTTWAGLQPYFAAMWAKLLSDLRILGPAKPVRLSLTIDGRQGAGHVWLVLAGGGSLPAAVANPDLTTFVHLEAPGVEVLVSDGDEEAALCQFANEVLSATRLPEALTAAEAVIALYPKAEVAHEAIDPEHGWYVPFKIPLSDLGRGKLPRVRWTYDFADTTA